MNNKKQSCINKPRWFGCAVFVLSVITNAVAATLTMADVIPLSETAPPTYDIYTLTPKHRPADSLVYSLRPLLPPGGSISAHKNTLIISTHEANLAQLQSLIDELDKPLQQLRLTVTDQLQADQDQHFNHRTNEQRTYTRRTTGYLGTQHQTTLQVLEGHSAYLIQNTNSAPIIVYAEKDEHRFKTLVPQEHTEAIVATPWIQGDNVTINLERMLEHRQKQVHAQSTVTGKLGEWITVVDLEADTTRPLGKIDTRRVKRRRGVFVKVELAEPTER